MQHNSVSQAQNLSYTVAVAHKNFNPWYIHWKDTKVQTKALTEPFCIHLKKNLDFGSEIQ